MIYFDDYDDLYHWFLTLVFREIMKAEFFFIIIMILEEFYNIFQNMKFKYIF